ncbi:MAG: ABC transporter substrate-binding protein [Dysosmobacter sp.]|nr:ABC transporter substrate-binding protein [Dysosmobacter sp.]
MKNKFIAMLLALAMVLSLAACGAKKEEAPADTEEEAQTEQPAETAPAEPAEEPITLNAAYMPNYGSLWAVTTAINKGYFDEAGITVKLTEFQDGPTIISAMESGTIDIGYIGQGAHKLCIQGNAKIFALSHISNGDAVIGGPDVKTLEDLKGKKVGYSSGTSSEDILKNALEKAGLTMNDITAVDMDASNIVTAMLSGGVDACATWSPNSLKILEEGKDLTKLCDNTTFSDKTVSLASWIVTPSYAEANADKILRFTKALFKAMNYAADDNYEEVAGYVAAQTKTDEASVYDQRGDADWLTGEEVARGAADGTVEKYYEIQQQNFIAAGAVEGEVPVSDYVMLDNMIEAGK